MPVASSDSEFEARWLHEASVALEEGGRDQSLGAPLAGLVAQMENNLNAEMIEIRINYPARKSFMLASYHGNVVVELLEQPLQLVLPL